MINDKMIEIQSYDRITGFIPYIMYARASDKINNL